MTTNKLLVIGSNSDLIQPLIEAAPHHKLEVMPIERKTWDLTNPTPTQELLDRVVTFNPRHLLYASGNNIPLDIAENPDTIIKSLRIHFDINCLAFISAVIHLNQLLPNPMISIHALSSLYGIYGRKNRLPYSVSKHALEGAVKCLAMELPRTLVLAYRPGFFSTKLTNKNLSSQTQENLKARIPAARLGKPDELSSVLLKNILDPPFYATGTSITMDGGLTAGGFFEF